MLWMPLFCEEEKLMVFGRYLLLITTAYFTQSAVAGLYKCKDENGAITYTSNQCVGEEMKIDVKPATSEASYRVLPYRIDKQVCYLQTNEDRQAFIEKLAKQRSENSKRECKTIKSRRQREQYSLRSPLRYACGISVDLARNLVRQDLQRYEGKYCNHYWSKGRKHEIKR